MLLLLGSMMLNHPVDEGEREADFPLLVDGDCCLFNQSIDSRKWTRYVIVLLSANMANT